MDMYLVIGVLGACITLTAFVLNQFGKLDEKQFGYDVMNLVSSMMLHLRPSFNGDSVHYH